MSSISWRRDGPFRHWPISHELARKSISSARNCVAGCPVGAFGVSRNMFAIIWLTELSSIADLSKRHFLRAFQESVGATPYHYVLSLRIDEAKRRLSETEDSITDVALGTGFSHAQHFSTSFRKATGLTPSSFRQRRE